MRCPSCNRDNPDDAKFCVGCGSPFARRCAKCGAENPSDASFCKQCGTRLVAEPVASAAVVVPVRVGVSAEQADSAPLDGERKTVTALFADIKGSTELEQDLDPEEARRIVDPALKLMIDAVRRYGGYIPQSTGTVSLRYSGRQLRTRTIPSARCMRRSGCRMISAASLNGARGKRNES